MSRVGSVAVAVVRFVYGFLFGDDWRVAAVVILGLIASAALIARAIPAWWLVPVLAIVMTGVSLRRTRRA